MSIPLAIVLLLVLAILAKEATGAGHAEPHKFAVKTIQSEDGDIVDCVDVYKQPSLEHLSSHNSTHQVFQSHRPSPFRSHGASNKLQQVQQVWPRSGRCPPGTIPIRRNAYPRDGMNYQRLLSGGDIERAIGFTIEGGPFTGGSAYLQVWGPQVEPEEYSMSYVTILNVDNPAAASFRDLNITDFVRAGWMVHPALYGDNQPRLFVQWSNDNGIKTGCFNLDCKGFVQMSSDYALGNRIVPLSVYDDMAHQYHLSVHIYLDAHLRRWYLQFSDQVVGYWPIDELFPEFSKGQYVVWGGQILNTWPLGAHTSTQMGNGHRAEEGLGRAAMAFHLQVYADNFRNLYYPSLFEDVGGCYNIIPCESMATRFVAYFLYGGPPTNMDCS